ncbi:hypothetical protein MCG98_12035 [Ruminococcus sp. OA3]|uniref:hypothetical protein n=1 Tax=Ruminococcus sp. OA3 TaxID=2914164 RepID=UPI001F054DD0|nr:hypothetical protein [Ruminococcus sp. OA3]MCH1983292.1 hypothetical protein [Ruminococcus sp. OA3]
MKMLTQQDYQEIRCWVLRNARPLDLALWKYYFEDGQREDIIDALACYQNEDGGFGNGIEPDCWNRESSPYATMIAMGMLRKTGFMEQEGDRHPIVQGIFRYLESRVHCDGEGWHFCIPSNSECPRAPWWTYSEESNNIQSMGITASICAFILLYDSRKSSLYNRARSYTEMILKKAAGTSEFGEMGAAAVWRLLGDLIQCGLYASFACDSLMERITEAVDSSIERNQEKWAFYTPRPSEFIWGPDSPLYKKNKDIVKKELDYLIDTRTPGGVWNITWSWYDLGEMYAKEFAISENWWMASKALDNVCFLKNFGRIAV